jgi:hypothetical protein
MRTQTRVRDSLRQEAAAAVPATSPESLTAGGVVELKAALEAAHAALERQAGELEVVRRALAERAPVVESVEQQQAVDELHARVRNAEAEVERLRRSSSAQAT